MGKMSTRKQLEKILSEKIMVLDGAFGTEIQRMDNTLLSPYEPLNATNSGLVKKVHRSYVASGSDIISTNSFNCSYLELLKHGFGKEEIDNLNMLAAKNAKEVAAEFNRDVFVAGSVGPTSQSLSLRTIEFDEMADSYKAQISSLITRQSVVGSHRRYRMADDKTRQTAFIRIELRIRIRESCRVGVETSRNPYSYLLVS